MHRIVRQYVQYNIYIYTENYQLSNILNGYDYVSRYRYKHISLEQCNIWNLMISSQRYANVKNCIRIYYVDYVNTFVIWIIINANIITRICKKFSSINKRIVMHTLIFLFQHQLTCNNISIYCAKFMKSWTVQINMFQKHRWNHCAWKWSLSMNESECHVYLCHYISATFTNFKLAHILYRKETIEIIQHQWTSVMVMEINCKIFARNTKQKRSISWIDS